MDYVIDRFEGDTAVLEDEKGAAFDIPKSVLPESAREGQVVSIIIDEAKTNGRKERIRELMEGVWED